MIAPATSPVPVQRDRRSRRRQPDPEESLFAALADEWRQAGRMVPGDRDREWVDAVVRKVWR